MSDAQRLQKILAAAGLGSRRACEALIAAGRVSVNGRRAALGESADPDRDEIALDGEPIRREAFEYWVVNKPTGVLSTVRDTRGRPTVMDLVPDRMARVYPVGRLDQDTEGLVLLTNDGELTHRMLHPSFGAEREYWVTSRGQISDSVLARLAAGVELDDGLTAPAQVGGASFDPSSKRTRFSLTLIEGKKRQIRRVMRELGHPVVQLVRVRMGPIHLGDLTPGDSRPATSGERRALLGQLHRAARSSGRN
jgi:23S rRNA pseudouridine2605 synthase